MRVMVTGGAGFIGSHLCEALLEREHEICGLDNFDPYYDRGIKERNLAGCREHRNFEFQELDILDWESLKKLARRFRPEVVVHLAALAGVQPSLDRPKKYEEVNVRGTMNIMEMCLEAGCSRVLSASSSSVYGDASRVPFDEADPCDRPVSPYAASKRSAELMAHTYHHIHGLDVANLRFFTVYGPRQRPEMAIAKFTRLIASERPVTLYGDGSSSRDYTFVSDIVSGVVSLVERRLGGYRIYNLGDSSPVRLSDLVTVIEHEVGRKARIQYGEARPGDVRRTWAAVDRAKQDLDYHPKVSIEQGVGRYVAWAKKIGAIS
ncbi:MAG: GDP-mannose 4,6-dehydratase [Deltaproteobacteria bacterium]|nr:GDP-mannose 4,6-dehydratase [Deltaproteobacteria bacterium]